MKAQTGVKNVIRTVDDRTDTVIQRHQEVCMVGQKVNCGSAIFDDGGAVRDGAFFVMRS